MDWTMVIMMVSAAIGSLAFVGLVIWVGIKLEQKHKKGKQ